MSRPYRVIWKARAVENDIASFVVRATDEGHDAEAISMAMNEIDRLLSRQPSTIGESRAFNERILFVFPLVVDFEVFDDEELVVVLRVRYSPKRN